MKKDFTELKKIIKAIDLITYVNIKKAKDRRQHISDAKKIYFHIAKKYTDYTYTAIGLFIGMNHATAIHNFRKASEFLEYDQDFKELYDKVFKEVTFVYTKKDYRDEAAKSLLRYPALKREADKLQKLEDLKKAKEKAKADIIKNKETIKEIESILKKAS